MVSFYAAAFAAAPDPAFPGTDCVRVEGLLLVFREIPDRVRPAWPGADMQMHLEVYVDDLRRQESRLVVLGATKPVVQDESDPTFTVLLDPAGHPFCIFERPTPTSTG
jgi:hypothetical protein